MDEMIINSEKMLFCDYYKQWIMVYKEGAIRPITMQKYYMAYRWLEKLVPKLQIQHLCSRKTNNYGFSSSFKMCDS